MAVVKAAGGRTQTILHSLAPRPRSRPPQILLDHNSTTMPTSPKRSMKIPADGNNGDWLPGDIAGSETERVSKRGREESKISILQPTWEARQVFWWKLFGCMLRLWAISRVWRARAHTHGCLHFPDGAVHCRLARNYGHGSHSSMDDDGWLNSMEANYTRMTRARKRACGSACVRACACVRAYVRALHTSEWAWRSRDGQTRRDYCSSALGEKKIAEGQKKCFSHHVAIKSSQEPEFLQGRQ